MAILANRSFIHLIALKNPFISILIKPIINITNYKQNPFIYIIIKRYTSKEFYSIIINISAFKKSIISYK
jgi:hypothetical protein